MTDDAHQVLREALNLARVLGIRRLPSLKTALLNRGWRDQTIDEAIQTWANYERAKRC